MATSYTLELIVEAVNKATGVLAKAGQQVGDIVTKATQAGTANATAAKTATTAWEKFNKTTEEVKDNLQKITQSANNIANASLKVALAGSAIFASFLFPVKQAAEFEYSLSSIQAVSKATQFEMEIMRDKAREMGESTIFSATQSAKAMVIMAQAGFNAAEIITALPSVLYLAAAGELSMAESANVAMSSMHGFNLTAMEFSHVADVIAYSAAKTNMTVREMSDSLKYVSPAASAAGASIDDVSAALGILSNAGIKGTMAGTALRSILIHLARLRPDAEAALRGMGVQVFDMEGKMRNFVDIIDDLAKANLTLTQAGKIFTVHAASGAMALVKNIEYLKQLTSENKRAADEAKRMADTMVNNVVGSLMKLKATLEATSITVVGGLLTPIKLVVDSITGLLNGFNMLMKGLGPVGSILLLIIGLLGSLAIVAGSVGLAFAGIIRVTGFLSTGIKMFTTAGRGAAIEAAGLTKVFDSLKSILGLIGAGFLRLGSWLAFTPWGRAVTVITALTAAMYSLAQAQDKTAAGLQATFEKSRVSREAFNQIYEAVQKTVKGSPEHIKYINDLIQRYPLLAGKLNIINQSWEEQDKILKEYQATLETLSLTDAANAIAALGAKFSEFKSRADAGRLSLNQWLSFEWSQLINILKYFGDTLGIIAWAINNIGTLKWSDLSDAFINSFSNMDKRAKQFYSELNKGSKDAARNIGKEIKNIMDTQWKGIDWKKAGFADIPLDMVKATEEELRKLLTSNDETAQAFVRAWEAKGVPLEKLIQLIRAINKEERDLLETKASKSKGFGDAGTISAGDFQAASEVVTKLVGKINTDFEQMPKAAREQMKLTIMGMEGPMAALGARFRAVYEQAVMKVIEAYSKMDRKSKTVMESMQLDLQVLTGLLEQMALAAQKPTIQLPGLEGLAAGGLNWQTTFPQFIKGAQGVESVAIDLRTALLAASSVHGAVLPQEFLAGLIKAESGFDKMAVSAKGAIGYLQIMPENLRRLGVAFDVIKEGGKERAVYDTAKYMQAGTKWLADLMVKYSGDWRKVVVEWNTSMKDFKGLKDKPWAEVEEFLNRNQKAYGQTTRLLRLIGEQTRSLSKDIGPGIFVKQRDTAALDQAKNYAEKAKSMYEQGLVPTLEAAWKIVEGNLNKELSLKLKMAQDDLEDTKTKEKNKIELIREKEFAVQKVRMANELALTQFREQKLKLYGAKESEIIQAAINKRELGLKVLEFQLSLTKSMAEVEAASASLRLTAGTIGGAEYERTLMAGQAASNKAEIDFLKEKRAQLEDIYRLDELDLRAKEKRNDILQIGIDKLKERKKVGLAEADSKIAEATNRQLIAEKKALEDLTKAAKDAISQIQDMGWSSMTAMDPIRAQQAEYNKAVWEAHYTWLQIEATITRAATRGVKFPEGWDAERALAEAKKNLEMQQWLKSPEGVMTKRWSEDMTQAVSTFVDTLTEGSKTMREAFNAFFKDMWKTASKQMYENLQKVLFDGFKAMFQSLGKLGSKLGPSQAVQEQATANAMGFQKVMDRPTTILDSIDRGIKSIDRKTGIGGGEGTGFAGTDTGIGTASGLFTGPKQEVGLPIDDFELGMEGLATDLVDIGEEAGDVLGKAAGAGIKTGAEEGGDIFSSMLKSIFGSGGAKGGAGDLGASIGNALMAGISLVGMLLTKSTSKSWSPSGVTSAVDSSQAVRGVIAGDTSIPIAEISVSLQDALVSTNGILTLIERNTRGDVPTAAASPTPVTYRQQAAAASLPQKVDVNITVNPLELAAVMKEAVTNAIEIFFAEQLMLGLK